jgi:hypothetical protein
MGIEPTCAAWKAAVLPLNYTRNDLQFSLWRPLVNCTELRMPVGNSERNCSRLN